MIFPILQGLVSWRKAPISWTLVALNILMLIYTSVAGRKAQEGLESLMSGKYFLTTQGRIYAQFVDRAGYKADYPPFLRALAEKVDHGEVGRAEMLGHLAFRDLNFLNSADRFQYEGDQVAFRYWQKRIEDVRLFQSEHPSFTLGLNAEDTSLAKWVSYIFVHSGALHLLGNMFFLFIFGSALERQIGGLGVLVVFLLSGVFAAGVFATMTGVTSSPLVGASGAVSGVMALYCFLNWNRAERFFYWFLLPFRGYMGFVYLPAWVALILWGLNDLAGYLGTLPEMGGVAYTAHLGGELAGLIIGGVLWLKRRQWPLFPREEQSPPMGKLFPLLPPKPITRSEQNRAA